MSGTWDGVSTLLALGGPMAVILLFFMPASSQNSNLLAGAVLQIREGTAMQRVVEALTSLQSSRVRPVALAH